MVPPPQHATDLRTEPLATRPQPSDRAATATWVRVTLLAVACGWTIVFGIAAWLNPYHEDGSARKMETHRQLRLPACTFKEVTGLPCPSCGMTTSFALLIHGDPVNSLQANWVGTLLAAFGLVLVPWSVVSAVRRRPLFVVAIDEALIRVMFVFLVLMMVRWGIVLALMFWGRSSSP
jgi:hypothetical protein